MQEVLEVSKAEVFVVVGSLVTVITILWKLVMAWYKKEEERLKKCEQLHENSIKEVNKLTGEFNYLKGRMDGVEQLSYSVLREIREVTQNARSNNPEDSRTDL